jgi:hypothetical protein
LLRTLHQTYPDAQDLIVRQPDRLVYVSKRVVDDPEGAALARRASAAVTAELPSSTISCTAAKVRSRRLGRTLLNSRFDSVRAEEQARLLEVSL